MRGLDVASLTRKMDKCKYELGAKASSAFFKTPRMVQVSSIDEIDCSGFVRLVVWILAGVLLPDGSWKQGEWFEANGFKVSTTEACKLEDNVLRLLWMTPAQGGGVGHIAFCWNGQTFESYGGNGPGSRKFTGDTHFQKVSKVFVLAGI